MTLTRVTLTVTLQSPCQCQYVLCQSTPAPAGEASREQNHCCSLCPPDLSLFGASIVSCESDHREGYQKSTNTAPLNNPLSLLKHRHRKSDENVFLFSLNNHTVDKHHIF